MSTSENRQLISANYETVLVMGSKTCNGEEGIITSISKCFLYMTALIPSSEQLLNDALDELDADWNDQDEMFYQDATMVTILPNVGKTPSYLAIIEHPEMKPIRKAFTERFCLRRRIKLGRLQEGEQIYHTYAKQGGSFMETCQRIFQTEGNWTKAVGALPAPKEIPTEVGPPKCSGKCPIHCKHEEG